MKTVEILKPLIKTGRPPHTGKDHGAALEAHPYMALPLFFESIRQSFRHRRVDRKD